MKAATATATTARQEWTPARRFFSRLYRRAYKYLRSLPAFDRRS